MKRLLWLVIASCLSTLLFCGCSGLYHFPTPSKVETPAATPTGGISSSPNKVPPSPSIFAPREVNGFSSTRVMLTPDGYDAFLSYVRGLKNAYHFENIFDIEKTMSKYRQRDNSAFTHTHAIVKPGEVLTADILFQTVKVNNAQYDEAQKKKLGGVHFNITIPDDELKEICAIIVEAVSDFLAANPQIDKAELYCTLGSLKVFYYTTANLAFVNEEKCLMISKSMLEVAKILYKENDALRDNITHETAHLIQMSCDDNPNTMIGISQKWDDLAFNALKFRWFYEASAEKSMHNITGHPYITYQYMIGYLESLNLVSSMRPSAYAGQAENLCFGKDVNTLFDMLGAETEAEKTEVMKLMLAVDVIQTDREDFFTAYAQSYSPTSDEDVVVIKRLLKADLCVTLSKLFYKNLANAVFNKQATLEDVFFLISLFEADINSHIRYEDDVKFEQNAAFMVAYLALQSNFFDVLSGSNGIKREEVDEKFRTYALKASFGGQEKFPNCDLGWLPERQAGYLRTRLNDLARDFVSSISRAYTQKIEGA